MSADKPENPGDPGDLSEIREALSTKVWFSALDNRVRQHPKFFDFLWQQRFWWVVATAATFILPVLKNDNTLTLSYSRSDNLYGFDLLVPMTSAYNTGAGASGISVSSFSINPLALVIYGLTALSLYLYFVKTHVSPRLTLWQGAIQTVLVILFPVLDISVLNIVLPKFSSTWHVQPPLWGYWILLVASLALLGGAYGQIVRGSPHTPPPLK